jgi:hypothetical protein
MHANNRQLEATLTDNDISLVRTAMEDAFEDMLQGVEGSETGYLLGPHSSYCVVCAFLITDLGIGG